MDPRFCGDDSGSDPLTAMSAADRLVDLLPSLWRPQPGDRTLLAEWLAAVGVVLDGAAANAQHVLRAHWADTADAALWAAHYQAERRDRRLPPANVRDPADYKELQRYPWIRDLARLAGLLDLPPWRDPASLRENVEEYRQRLGDVVDAYRTGLTTPAALRRLVDAALPEDMTAPLARQRASFALEEPMALLTATTQLTAIPAVQEGDLVAPLSRWTVEAAGTPAFVLQGVAPDENAAATAAPLIERYTPGGPVVGIGVGWTGTLAPGQALRFAPGRRTWLLRAGALHASSEETADSALRDPSANGPWTEAASLSAGRAVALTAAPDGALWVTQRTQQTWRVQRHNGASFAAVDTDAPAGPYNALLCAGDSAWLGTDAGLFRCPLWPESGPLTWAAVAGVNGAIRALAATPEGLRATGAAGLWSLDLDGTVLTQDFSGVEFNAFVGGDQHDILATEQALFQCRSGACWRFEGASVSEDQPDWQPVPAPDAGLASPLPAITALAETPDGSLWLGSPAGLARWYAADNGTTRLEAFPDLIAGAVLALTVDERGMLWIGSELGLFRYDGRDLAQHDFATATWTCLGRADSVYPDDISIEQRGHWRFDGATDRWLRWDAVGRRFADPGLAVRSTASDPIAAVLPLSALRAELGSWDGSAFTATGPVPAGELRLRIKPDETRILTGVLPYLPESLAGCTWRYLQMEPAPTPPAEGRPWWSKEGQLFPPPVRRAAVPGHYRDDADFLTNPEGEGQFDQAAFAYPPSARLWVSRLLAPAVGIRIRLFLADPAQPIDPALAERVWKLIARARPAGVPLQLMAEGRLLKESTT
jgi:hypothetical protein